MLRALRAVFRCSVKVHDAAGSVPIQQPSPFGHVPELVGVTFFGKALRFFSDVFLPFRGYARLSTEYQILHLEYVGNRQLGMKAARKGLSMRDGSRGVLGKIDR